MMSETTKDWCMTMAALEGDSEIGAGLPPILDSVVERALDALGGKMIDGRRPYHDSDMTLMRAAIRAALNPAPPDLS